MRPRTVALLAGVAALVLLVGVGAYYTGVFTDDGRFTRPVQACDLATAADLGAMLAGPAPNEADSKPSRTFFGVGDGDRDAQCKWDRTRQGSPLRAVVVRVHQRVEDAPSRSAPDRAHAEFLRGQRGKPGIQAVPGLGEEADTRVDVTKLSGPFLSSSTEDLHVRYRVSNVIVDISGRLLNADRDEARAALLALARRTATRLDGLAG